MLLDWLWATAITLLLWLEIAGWSTLVQRYVIGRGWKTRIPASVLYALTFAIASQAYFALSLTGLGDTRVQLLAAAIGVVLFFVNSEHAKLGRLRAARYYSPLTWKRAWPWVALPCAWLVLRLIDTLVPHNHPSPLGVSLFFPHQWLEDGGQQLDPLHPSGGLASVWEGLYYHAQAVVHALHGSLRAFGAPHRTALVRAQLSCQLLHFTAGQALSVVVLAAFIRPFIQAGWNVLVHQSDPKLEAAQRRHQLGTAGAVAVPSSLCFAWLACGQTHSTLGGTLADNEWGVALFTLASLSLFVVDRQALAWLLALSAMVANPGVGLGGWAAAAGFAAVSVQAFRARGKVQGGRLPRTKELGALALAATFALGPWALRNLTQAGSFFFPPLTDTSGPGWGLRAQSAALTPVHAPLDGASLFVLTLGLAGTFIYGWRRRLHIEDRAFGAALLFVAGTALLLPWSGWSAAPFFIAPALAVAMLGIEFLITIVRHPKLVGFARHVPYFWLVLGLFVVPLPVHVVWQHLGLAATPAEAYLSRFHPHYEAKHWASVQLPPNTRVAWTSDSQFYYLEQPALSIAESQFLRETLARKTNPRDRARALCELGVDVLAWEDRHHGPEVSGLASWLKLHNDTFLHTSDDVTLFDLRGPCKTL